MTDTSSPVPDHDLHAYADGQLPPGEAARIEAWLAAHPDIAERVAGWKAQNDAIRAMFAPYETAHPEDVTLVTDKTRETPLWRRRSWQAAAAVALFALGNLTGSFIPSLMPERGQPQPIYRQADDAYRIYSSDVRHPVEVRADEKDHLVAWLGKRLGHRLVAPDLSGAGFSLVGGRLVPVDGEAGALLMYEDAAGKRLTVLLGRSAENRDTSFRFASSGKVETFYWIDGRLTYAVSGEISRDRLRTIADDCYQQFQAFT